MFRGSFTAPVLSRRKEVLGGLLRFGSPVSAIGQYKGKFERSIGDLPPI